MCILFEPYTYIHTYIHVYVVVLLVDSVMPSYSVSLSLLPLRLPQVTLIGASAAFSQSLGLSGGLAPLTLYYGRSFALPALLLWTLIAACFGVFLGLCFGNPLVRNSRYPWPIAQVRREETEPIVQGVSVVLEYDVCACGQQRCKLIQRFSSCFSSSLDECRDNSIVPRRPGGERRRGRGRGRGRGCGGCRS